MKGSIEEKLRRVAELDEVDIENHINLPTGLLRHAVLNSIPLFELVKFFIAEGSHIKSISANLCKRLEEVKDSCKIYDEVLKAVKISNYLTRQRLRQLLEVMILRLDEHRQLEYVSFFLSSTYTYEQNSAVELAEKVWNDDIELLLLQVHQRSQNQRILSTLILRTNDDKALELIREQWHGRIPKALIVKFMSRLKGRTVEQFDFLRLIDPANYIALLRYAKGNIDDKILQECYYRIPEKSKPFALWNLGHLGKWDLIEQETGNFIRNPSEAFPGFSDNLFEK